MITLPEPSFTVAESCCVAPEERLRLAGDTTTLLIAPADTISVALPLFPFDAAVIVALPAWEAVTRPLDDTVPTDELELDQLTGRSLSTFPVPSLIVADSCCVLPAARPRDPGVTDTLAAAPATMVMVAVAFLPSAVAVRVALPALLPVTRPPVLTEATVLFELAQATARPVSSLPLASDACAVSCTVVPELIELDDGVIESVEIGVEATPTVALSETLDAFAMIFAVPVLAPVTVPLGETVARWLSVELHVTAWPVRTRPVFVLMVADSVTWPPTVALATDGCTSTLAGTLSVTARGACPETPSLVA